MQKIPIDFQVRTMNESDIPQLIEILKQTDWAIELCDPHNLFEIDPNGWKVAVSSTGEVLGVCCAVQHNEDFHYIGYYVVKKGYRGMGIGSKIWNACMEYIGSNNACLNCLPGMVEKYKNKSKFINVDTDSLFTYTSQNQIQVENLSSKTSEGVSIVPFDNSHLPAVLQYDGALGDISQSHQRIIELSCKDENNKTFVAFKDGVCAGFGTMKITLMSIPHVSPLYADNPEIAESMLKKLLQSFPDHKGLVFSTFAANKAANDLMEKINCPKIYECYHIYIRKDGRRKFKSSIHKLFGALDLSFAEF